MERALQPGMRLMRRLGVTGKFALIAVLLLLPLATTVAASLRESARALAVVDAERAGLRSAAPLVNLVIKLADAGDQQGPDAATAVQLAVQAVDAAHSAANPQLGLPDAWTQLRPKVLDALADGRPPDERARLISAAARDARKLIAEVAASSRLSMDGQLDGRHLAVALTDRLPRLVVAIADARDTEQGPATTRAVAAADLAQVRRDLAVDLAGARAATGSAQLRRTVNAPAARLDQAVLDYHDHLTGRTATNPIIAEGAVGAAADLAGALTAALDELLAQRQVQLTASRNQPLLLTTVVLCAVGYLLLALFVATTRDVHTVLAEIRTVTTGEVHQTTPLPGSDEFADMSREIIYARDQLTALVGSLKYQATRDELTALGNRSYFLSKTDEALASGGKAGDVVVVLIDLDGFKDINDSFGHDMADRVLRMIGARLHRTAPRRSSIARVGSDDFAVLLTDVRDPSLLAATLDQLTLALAQPVDVDGRQLRVRAGIGHAVTRPGRMSALELVRNAAVALSHAQHSPDRAAAFEPGMHDRTRERTELSGDLVQAVERDELTVVYQPIVDLSSSALYGVEALVRWDHPVRGPISPAVFIPLAEATGQIVPIGRWVLHQACQQLARWQQQFPDDVPPVMDVNLSPGQLMDASLVAAVLDVIEQTGVDAGSVVLEITESALAQDVDTAVRRLAQLSAVGLRIALDDFGTGYSSLSYLRKLPVTVLKIDKSFVGDGDERGRDLLRSIVALGTGQGMQIVAEGIEHADQARLLAEAGCHLGQGHLWSRAITADEVTELLRARRLGQGGQQQGMRQARPLELDEVQ